MKNYLMSSLIPFINEDEIIYYAKLTEEVLSRLVSLAPFVEPTQLRRLSKLEINDLEKLSKLLANMNFDEVQELFRIMNKHV